MILRAKNEYGFYNMAALITTDEDGVEMTTHYTIPMSRTILMGKDGGFDIIRHNPDTGADIDRLKASTEYIADNDVMLMARRLDLARKTITVGYGEEESALLDDYVLSGKNTSLITSATTAGDYYKSE